ncbi:MAG: hypothetical protein EWM72_02857 [Nitrospira sp.]|nr:MAG: hypothetical protein EWM72_02857 [Nitrospira sp.]
MFSLLFRNSECGGDLFTCPAFREKEHSLAYPINLDLQLFFVFRLAGAARQALFRVCLICPYWGK